MKKLGKKKLQLDTTTIRELRLADLGSVNGAALGSPTGSCMLCKPTNPPSGDCG